MNEVESVQTDELEPLKKQHANASFGILSQSSFHCEQKNLMFLILKLLKNFNLSIDILMKKCSP